MKIAIVGPSPVPYTIGGAENLMWGFCDAINQYTPHQAELIKLPSPENNFWNLIQSYYDFYQLDLSYFDLVICTKYPSWMVKHNNCICYMVHTLRGLYDTYHLMNMPEHVKKGNKRIDELLHYMENNQEYEKLDQFFKMLFELKNQNDVPKEYFAFPGPFIRKIIHYLDQVALSRPTVKKFVTMSDTVKKRTDYFPPNVPVSIVYPPSNKKHFKAGAYQHIFMISRLDGAKRIDMLIRAMKYVESDVKLYIAGTGPMEQELKKLAQGDDRIEFLGFVSDAVAEDYYSNSLVIPYFPYDEDYGLITLEAMMHKKPVITTIDAGGPTEFVENNETGYVVKFDERAIAEKIDYFAKNPSEAERMGNAAYERMNGITWEYFVNGVLNDEIPEIKKKQITYPKNRKSITVTSTFSVYPPQGGGQARIYNLYKNIAKEYDVEIVSFTNVNERETKKEIADGLYEICVPKSGKHQEKEWEMQEKIGIPVTDVAMLTLSGETEKYGEELKRSIIKSDMVIVSHPYLYYEVKKYLGNKSFIYEAHNVESIMKKEMFPSTTYSKKLVDDVFECEKECCEKSKFIMTCSEEDKEKLVEIYNVKKEKIIVVPNGVDTTETSFVDWNTRQAKKRELGLQNNKIGLFMGSWHKPNLEACEAIFKIAKQCPEVTFLLMGSQCEYFKTQKNVDIPNNVGMLGLVDEAEKERVFSIVDFALNPMMSGSGTNLKMFDYMSAGIPIITTEFGTRGIENKDVFIISEVDEMAVTINSLEINGDKVVSARKYVEDVFDWSIISSNILDWLKK